jgi:Protein of unknown function (DUF1688)
VCKGGVLTEAQLKAATVAEAAAAKAAEPLSRHPLAPLHDPGTVRARCAAILRAVESNVSEHFTIDRSRLPAVAERVAALTLKRFPDLKIPYHSRWRHFEAGGIDRKPILGSLLAKHSAADAARARFDLTVVSVLLDAGAGPDWRYTESDGLTPEPTVLARSEGLGVASFNAFLRGAFSASPTDPLRADAAALEKIDVAALKGIFQVTSSNPMVGLEGRAGLLARLGATLRKAAAGSDAHARPALLYERLSNAGPDGQTQTPTHASTSATDVLVEVLRTLGPIWTSGRNVQGLPAGDVWPHRWAGAAIGGGGQDPTTGGWVPFHKLSQWLTYSLLEPLQWAGIQVTGLDALTGLPEYRNGGLLLDAGLIVPRNPRDLARTWKPQDDFIVEWRALTVALLDEVAAAVRTRLGKTAEEMPLACILEGGTWAAGREIAAELRANGGPPLKIESDGTIF